MCLDEHPPKQVKIWTQKKKKFHSRVNHLKDSVRNYFSTFSHHVMHCELSAGELWKVHDNEPASRAVAGLHQLQMTDQNNRYRSSVV